MTVKEDSINRFGESSRTFNLEEQSQSKPTQEFLFLIFLILRFQHIQNTPLTGSYDQSKTLSYLSEETKSD